VKDAEADRDGRGLLGFREHLPGQVISSTGQTAANRRVPIRPRSGAAVDLAAALPELLRLLAKPLRDRRRLLRDAVLGRVVADILRDLHRAEVRPRHRAEVGDEPTFASSRR